MDMKRLTFALASLLVITGCSHNSDTSSSDHSTASSNASQSTSDKTEAKPFGQTSTASKADPTTPLTSYNQPTGPSWLTYIFVSRLSPQPSDEEKMKLFSPAYYNESDTFKKHDILTAGLPKVNSTLDEYKAQNYYVFQTKNPFAYGMALLKPYDFSTQSFQLEDCSGVGVSNQGVSLRLRSTPAMCNLKVTDTNTARAIENLRAHFLLGTKFTTYFFVDGVDASRNEVEGTITHLHIDFSDLQSNRIVASFDVN